MLQLIRFLEWIIWLLWTLFSAPVFAQPVGGVTSITDWLAR